jgi:NADH dehydrogenase FAD-containing subunit
MSEYFSDKVYLNTDKNPTTPFSYKNLGRLVFLDNNNISKSIHKYWTGTQGDVVKEFRKSVEKILKELENI